MDKYTKGDIYDFCDIDTKMTIHECIDGLPELLFIHPRRKSIILKQLRGMNADILMEYIGYNGCIRLMNEYDYMGSNDCLEWVCRGDHIELVQLMIHSGVDNFRKGFIGACHSDNVEIVKLMLDRCGNGINNLDRGFEIACSMGYIDTVKLLIDNGAKPFNGGLRLARYHGHTNVVNLILETFGEDRCEL